MKRKQISTALFLSVFVISACQMGNSNQMSKSQQRQMQSTYKSMQKSYNALIEDYEQDSASMPADIKNLYAQMKKMHQQMAKNHNHMMAGHKEKGMDMHQENDQMQKRHQMRRRIQNGMSREWYSQMESMHQQMAHRYGQMNNPQKEKRHRQLGHRFSEMRTIIPQEDQSLDSPVNANGDPAVLNGGDLYHQNCATCHGRNGNGVGSTFPPLINSEWVTGDKSVPVRIVKDGLQGKIEVNGKTYSGTMPSFRARLSLAEIAAIINYLREMSGDYYPSITQEDMIRIYDTYQNRNEPWQADELLGE